LAWIYMMLISFLMVFLLLCLSLIGLNFENSMPLTLAAFSNTGPLLSLSQEAAIALVDLSILEKALLGLAMILGRLEVLALVAVLMPRAWQA
jgi:trk system potassium uptake protein